MLTRYLWQQVCCVLLGALAADAQTALGPAFTYQGRLKEAGAPVNNPAVPMRFRLYDAAVGGNQVGSDYVPFGGVYVADGLFTVEPDFGFMPFSGDARWMEIEVNGTTLSPRQELTAVPYALYALNAPSGGGGTVTSIGQDTGILLTPNPLTTTGTVEVDPAVVPRLAAANTFTGAQTFTNAANSFTGTGAGLTTLNASKHRLRHARRRTSFDQRCAAE